MVLDINGPDKCHSSLFQASASYSGPRTRRQGQQVDPEHFLIPATCADSDLDVDDDILEDAMDDDTLDSDFLLDLPDDLTPTVSGKQ